MDESVLWPFGKSVLGQHLLRKADNSDFSRWIKTETKAKYTLLLLLYQGGVDSTKSCQKKQRMGKGKLPYN